MLQSLLSVVSPQSIWSQTAQSARCKMSRHQDLRKFWRVEKKAVPIALKTRKFTTHSRREGQLFRCQFWDLVLKSRFLTLSAHTLSCQSDNRSKELVSLLEFAKSDEQTVCCFTRLGRVGTSGFSTFPWSRNSLIEKLTLDFEHSIALRSLAPSDQLHSFRLEKV